VISMREVTAVGAFFLASALPLAGQSVLAAGGLGVPIDPTGARGRALGSVGIGLLGTGVTPSDPVGHVDLSVPTISTTLQSAWLDLGQAAETGRTSGSRFPGLGVSYPVGGWGVVTLTYGAVLDQRWVQERADTVDLEGGSVLPVLDRFSSDGGVSAARIGFAHRVSPSLAVGVTVGVMTGSSTRLFSRAFDTLAADIAIAPFQSSGHWSYHGTTATVGALFDVGGALRGAGSVTWSSALDAEPLADTGGEARSYDMPLEVRAALSAQLAPRLSTIVSFGFADWSGTTADLEEGSAVSTLALGAGVEWEGATLFGKVLPLRVGWRRADLPFEAFGAEALESGLSFGAGLVLLARSDDLPLAQMDLGLERGSRTAGSVAEDFWRSTLSLRVAGF